MSASYTVSLAGGANVAMTTEELVSAFNVGMIKEQTMVWREGLENWAPLTEFASELGVSVRTTTPSSGAPADEPVDEEETDDTDASDSSVADLEQARKPDVAISFRPKLIHSERERAEALAREAHLKRAKECAACGHVGRPIRVARGSSEVEVLLWLCLIVPGIFYSMWRRKGAEVCAMCGRARLTPLPIEDSAELAH